MLAWLVLLREVLGKACQDDIEMVKKVNELINELQYKR